MKSKILARLLPRDMMIKERSLTNLPTRANVQFE